jgi:hypothetical protein
MRYTANTVSSKNVNNIKYEIEEGAIEFSFTYKDRGFLSAYLQLPTTSDSVHKINDEDLDNENEEHCEIFETLKSSYYKDFKNNLCAKASIVCQNRVLHVEEVTSHNRIYYVAFCENGSIQILKEGSYSSYYNVFYFEQIFGFEAFEEEDLNDEKLIEEAKNNFFDDLKLQLKLDLEKSTDNQHCDDIVGAFMRKNFENDWESNDFAEEFYETIACDQRIDAEYNLKSKEEREKRIK